MVVLFGRFAFLSALLGLCQVVLADIPTHSCPTEIYRNAERVYPHLKTLAEKFPYGKDGFYRVATASPRVFSGDPYANANEAIKWAMEAGNNQVKLLAFPEENVHGYFIDDIQKMELVMGAAMDGLALVVEASKTFSTAVIVGSRFRSPDSRSYNTAFVVQGGKIWGAVPKEYLPTTGEFTEARQVSSARVADMPMMATIPGHPEIAPFPFGQKLIFQIGELTFAIEVCEDGWNILAPGNYHIAGGAFCLVNVSASNELRGKRPFRRLIFGARSALGAAAIMYGSEAPSETSRMVASGDRFIMEGGRLLDEGPPLHAPKTDKRQIYGMTVSEIDVHSLAHDRGDSSFMQTPTPPGYTRILISNEVPPLSDLARRISPMPFVPNTEAEVDQITDETIGIVKYGIAQRFTEMGAKRFILGLSGGKDSLLAAMFLAETCDHMGLPRSTVVAMNMRGFGNTDETVEDARALAREFGFTFEESDIRDQARAEMIALGIDPDDDTNVIFQNSQARIRMDRELNRANMPGEMGLVIGTETFTEAIIGWNTYGDEKAGYNPCNSVPKTLVPPFLRSYARRNATGELQSRMFRVADRPSSPELKKVVAGQRQSSEKEIGSEALNDFFGYYTVRFGHRPRKLYRMALIAFSQLQKDDGTPRFTDGEIHSALKQFYERIFTQQFKRTVFPAGVMTGSASPDPRGVLRWPDMISRRAFLQEVNQVAP